MKNPTQNSPSDTKQKEPQKSSLRKSLIIKLRSPLLFIVVFSLSLLLLYRIDQTLRITTLDVHGAMESLPFKGISQYKGFHIWDITEEDVEEYLTSANPSYRIVSVTKKYPSQVIVEVSRLIPSAYLTLSEGYVLLSKEGIVLNKSRDEPDNAYPQIAFYQQVPYNALQRGDEIGYKEIKDSLYFLDIVQAARLKVERIDIGSFYMLGLYTESGGFIFSSEKDQELQKYQFEQSMKQLSLEGIEFETLDFRYDKPIVRL